MNSLPKSEHMMRWDMHKAVRAGVLYAIDAVQIPRLALAMRGPQPFILLYHGVTAEKGVGIFNYRAKFITPDAFREQIRWLKRRYRIVPLTEITDALAACALAPRGAVAITFDDGYANNFADAYRILKEENAPATFFITTDFVEKQSPLPVDIIEYAIGTTPGTEITLDLGSSSHTFSLRSYQERVRTDLRIRSYMKTLEGSDVALFLNNLIAKTGPDLRRDIMHTPYRPLSWEEVLQMEEGGMTFAPHTRSHSILSRLTPAQVDTEITESTDILRAHTKDPLAVFAYPNGRTEDFNAAVVASLKKNGFFAALTTRSGAIDSGVDPFYIPRYTLDGSNQLYRFRSIISGVTDALAGF